MPDFDTRTPQEERNKPLRHRIALIANKLHTLVIASKPHIMFMANRLRTLLMANRLRVLLIGGVLLLVVVAIPLGFLLNSSSGIGDQQQNVEAARSKPLTGGCLGNYRTFGSMDYSPDGQKIVFVSYYNYDDDTTAGPASAPGTSADEADNEICVVNADGTGMVRLTDDSNDESSAVWSPDGNKIAFIRYIWEETSPHSAIAIMNADGSDEIPPPGTGGANWGVAHALDWSPDGENLAFAAGDCDIYITRADGSGMPRKLTSDPAWQCSESPAWSPDGKSIAFQSERRTNPNALGDPKDIYVLNALGEGDTEQWRQLTDDPVQDAYPAWSPDSTEITFNRFPELGLATIYKVSSDGSRETRLASGGLPTWLPDGNHVAYLAEGGLYVANADGSNPALVIADTVE